MKKILLAFTMLLAMAACTNKPVTIVENSEENSDVAFEVAKNYFFKNDQVIPEYPKITTEEEFNKFFGMATTMGKDGKPTAIDFTKQFVLAIVLPVTDIATEINPVKVEEKGDSLLYTYDVKTGEKQSFTIQPVSIIILDKQYENKRVVLLNERETTAISGYSTTISRVTRCLMMSFATRSLPGGGRHPDRHHAEDRAEAESHQGHQYVTINKKTANSL